MDVDARGVRTYYDELGTGEPVVLLHGGGVTADSWQGQARALAAQYRVLIPERRGHGRTPDVDGPVSMEIFAADTAAFVEALELGPVHVVGWSDGGKVGMSLALSRPDLVRKLVLIGTELTHAGGTAANQALLEPGGLEFLAAAFRAQYEPLSPDGPEHFDVVFAKWAQMWKTLPDVELAVLKALPMPVLLMQGDDDCVRIEHTAEVARAIPDAQVAVVPGSSHGLPLEKPEVVNRLLLDFLAGPQAPKFMPLGDLSS
ncbi:pimeloyl-ACP methyl ester carboxylesterase [Kribbella sp. VKM Ac-2569]|uniref:alpha/beta fold hydrolase n=1 Tax=Kribbella sp. VKM Ac-2569 TaxID=2512220 RepID=UPI00102C88BC|nr:alpha/beta hydrolase [Kribbella sp. VKM Ac-2569]RZT17259.1 pimeloyl-ACP methyl ester carboxylesterase [Kribbella sp. VKM Ac-2569]